jgi:PAS domain S-box-containing protein
MASMKAILSQERILSAIAAFAVGIAVSSLIHTPFGLLAPVVALFLFAGGRTGLVLHVVSATGLVGSLLVAALYEGEARDFAATWAAFFALAICIGALVATRGSASPGTEPRAAALQGTTPERAPSYPVVGPSLEEKAAPRDSPVVGITAWDDNGTAALLVAVSFWAGLPFHVRYWRRQPHGRYRWVESRSEPLPEPSGTRRWRAITAEVDDQRAGKALPTKIASNPPSDDDAVRAAKIVENLLGNAWAFDAAGRPTYLTPFAQTLVAVTLDEFQAAVDEGHTFFKRTAHPDEYDRISAAWRRSLQTGDPFFLDRRIQRASGIHEWNRTGFVPTRDKHGRITGWYGSMIDLDSHRITQAELRERERELSQLVDMVPSHIWRLTPDGEPVFFNKRMVDFLGFDIADAGKRRISRLDAVIEAVHPDDAAEFRDALAGGLASGETFAMRYRLRRADGVYRWMDCRAEPLRDQDSAIVQWYGATFDIDDQVRLYNELEDREAKIRRLVDSDIIGIVIWDLDGRLIDANDAFLRMVQYDREDLKAGLGWFAMTPPEWQEVHAREEAEELARTGKMQAREKEYFRKDGSRVPVLIGAACFEGQSNQGVAYIHDLTEQKRAEAALRARERELQEIIDAVPVRIWRAAPNDGPVYFNKRYQDHFRSVIADFDALERPRIGALLQELVHPDEAPGVERTLGRCFESGDGAVLRFRWREKDDAYRWAECRVESRRDQSGAIVQWYGASVDIDDEMRAQTELRRMQERLAQASQAASLAELSASIAHEVNQPLAAIVANSHACQRWLIADSPNLERAQATIERIIRDANGAADVVARIRALFKQNVTTRSGSSLAAVIADAERWVSDLAMRHGVVLDSRIEPGVPSVAVDQVQIQQVLINLMRNSVEAMATSPGDKTLSVRASRDGDAVRIEVRDTGPGVENAEKIFDPFFTTKESGMGMGLAVSRSIVKSHGGRLWAEQNRDGGASFIFILPIEAPLAC